MTDDTKLLDGRVEVRFDDKGEFDELVLGEGKECTLHLEMMSDNQLWIGIYPKGCEDAVHVTISSSGKLAVVAHEA